jgi:hypothetical protein
MSLSAQAPYLWGSEFNDLPKNVWCKNKNKGQSLYSSVWCHYLYKAILLISPPVCEYVYSAIFTYIARNATGVYVYIKVTDAKDWGAPRTGPPWLISVTEVA